MSNPEPSKRKQLLRNIVIFQLKLSVDGLRDLVLLPVSLVAAFVGFMRGGDEPERELNQVIEYGRQTEEWINLFGQHGTDAQAGTDTQRRGKNSHSLASIDAVFNKVEEALRQSYKSGETSQDTQSEIDEALSAAHEKARKSVDRSTIESTNEPAE